MKTIEERADAYVGHPFEIDEFSSTTAKRQAFIDGAKEQRKIDIEKACDWLFLYVGLYVNDEGYVETHELLRDLSKAMEE